MNNFIRNSFGPQISKSKDHYFLPEDQQSPPEDQQSIPEDNTQLQANYKHKQTVEIIEIKNITPRTIIKINLLIQQEQDVFKPIQQNKSKYQIKSSQLMNNSNHANNFGKWQRHKVNISQQQINKSLQNKTPPQNKYYHNYTPKKVAVYQVGKQLNRELRQTQNKKYLYKHNFNENQQNQQLKKLNQSTQTYQIPSKDGQIEEYIFSDSNKPKQNRASQISNKRYYNSKIYDLPQGSHFYQEVLTKQNTSIRQSDVNNIKRDKKDKKDTKSMNYSYQYPVSQKFKEKSFLNLTKYQYPINAENQSPQKQYQNTQQLNAQNYLNLKHHQQQKIDDNQNPHRINKKQYQVNNNIFQDAKRNKFNYQNNYLNKQESHSQDNVNSQNQQQGETYSRQNLQITFQCQKEPYQQSNKFIVREEISHSFIQQRQKHLNDQQASDNQNQIDQEENIRFQNQNQKQRPQEPSDIFDENLHPEERKQVYSQSKNLQYVKDQVKNQFVQDRFVQDQFAQDQEQVEEISSTEQRSDDQIAIQHQIIHIKENTINLKQYSTKPRTNQKITIQYFQEFQENIQPQTNFSQQIKDQNIKRLSKDQQNTYEIQLLKKYQENVKSQTIYHFNNPSEQYIQRQNLHQQQQYEQIQRYQDKTSNIQNQLQQKQYQEENKKTFNKENLQKITQIQPNHFRYIDTQFDKTYTQKISTTNSKQKSRQKSINSPTYKERFQALQKYKKLFEPNQKVSKVKKDPLKKSNQNSKYHSSNVKHYLSGKSSQKCHKQHCLKNSQPTSFKLQDYSTSYQIRTNNQSHSKELKHQMQRHNHTQNVKDILTQKNQCIKPKVVKINLKDKIAEDLFLKHKSEFLNKLKHKQKQPKNIQNSFFNKIPLRNSKQIQTTFRIDKSRQSSRSTSQSRRLMLSPHLQQLTERLSTPRKSEQPCPHYAHFRQKKLRQKFMYMIQNQNNDLLHLFYLSPEQLTRLFYKQILQKQINEIYWVQIVRSYGQKKLQQILLSKSNKSLKQLQELQDSKRTYCDNPNRGIKFLTQNYPMHC